MKEVRPEVERNFYTCTLLFLLGYLLNFCSLINNTFPLFDVVVLSREPSNLERPSLFSDVALLCADSGQVREAGSFPDVNSRSHEQ